MKPKQGKLHCWFELNGALEWSLPSKHTERWFEILAGTDLQSIPKVINNHLCKLIKWTI